MKEYEGSTEILIADVDCTTGGKSLCNDVGIKGYPTIKYGDPNNLEKYEGGRSLKDLQAFAKEKLGPTCCPKNPDLCDEDQKKQLAEFVALPASDLRAKIEEKEKEMTEADTAVDELLKKLQSQYEEAMKARDDKKAEIKASGLGLMKSVEAHQRAGKSEL